MGEDVDKKRVPSSTSCGNKDYDHNRELTSNPCLPLYMYFALLMSTLHNSVVTLSYIIYYKFIIKIYSCT